MSVDTPVMNWMRERDNQLNEEMAAVYGDASKMIEVLSKRYQLFSSVLPKIKEPLNHASLMNMRESVFSQMSIWKVKQDVDEQIAQIISRMSDLEEAKRNH